MIVVTDHEKLTVNELAMPDPDGSIDHTVTSFPITEIARRKTAF